MSGSNSSAPASAALPEPRALAPSPLGLTVHTPPRLAPDDAARRTAAGRMKMMLVLAVCAAPVIASYVTYFFIRPEGRTNYGTLIQPLRPVPADLPLSDLDGRPVSSRSLVGKWLLVVVAGGACDTVCEKNLWLQRQLRETLGRDKERVVKVWLVDDGVAPRRELVDAIRIHTDMTILRAPAGPLSTWLTPAPGHRLEDHFYIVDPIGHWMMREPAAPEPRKLKSDIEKLLRASAGWNGSDR